MAEQYALIAEHRTDQGKGASRRLRKSGKIPAVIYGGGEAPMALTLEANPLTRMAEKESFYSHILTLHIDGKEQQAIVKDLQPHPARRVILHLDLQRIVANEEIRVYIPIHFINEEICPGVKTGGGMVQHMQSEVEVSCLPKYLPEYLEVDIGMLNIDDMLHLSDIKLPEGVEIIELTHGEGHDNAIVAVHVLKAAAEEPVEGQEVSPDAVPAAKVSDKEDDKKDEKKGG